MFKKIKAMLKDESAAPYIAEMVDVIVTNCCSWFPTIETCVNVCGNYLGSCFGCAPMIDSCMSGIMDFINTCVRTCYGFGPFIETMCGK